MKFFENFNLIETTLNTGVKAIGHILSFAVLAALIAAWILSSPFLNLGKDFFPRGTRPGRGQNPPRRLIGNEVRRAVLFTIAWLAGVMRTGCLQAQNQSERTSDTSLSVPISRSAVKSIWQGEVGKGFKPGTQSVNLSVGAGCGVTILGSEQNHDLALISLSYGYMLGSVKGIGHWYRGNWELRGELFTGAQFSPSKESLVGLTPHLRYNFATGTRWIPFVDIGAGVSATSIGPPDLSGTFEFNLQTATGVRWFIRDDVALGIEARYLHMSCAGIHPPNLGLNNVGGMVGITWFF